MTAKAKVAPSRKSTHSIMANSGFGKLTIHKPEGVTVVIPQEHIRKDGRIKKNVSKLLSELTKENIETLELKGVKIHTR